MEYNPVCIGDNGDRYFLKQEGRKPLFALGLNPSTADSAKPDATMLRIMGFAERNGFDSFVMINLYPQRATNPDNLDSELNVSRYSKNLINIKNLIRGYDNPTILLCYGNSIKKRAYLKKCLIDIIRILTVCNPQFVIIGKLTKEGNPRHPSRCAYVDFSKLDIDSINLNQE